MKIAIIGVTDRVGSRVAAEALRRGHTVTGIVRSVEKIDTVDGVALVQGAATKPEQLAPLIKGHNAVVSALIFAYSQRRLWCPR